ncbi:hypothetical protein SH580_04300 [Coraliomargarita algicola]|uniref:Autotransporter-associated beta strand repeat protein n=1 Tax=Coraliomargarita algicola TaxID=3092156 RepID=A0ABZ0RN35_9BACT|nr:hypothetical protein [Coraliomargarita sp. J2-16]WPJ96927.1 hypothetical protein SH580_04300 [Coraliomargarita sp. J2-16]
MKSLPPITLPAMLALSVAGVPLSLLADATWTDTDGGVWSDTANWSTDPVLPSNDGTQNITFNGSMTGTSTVDANWSISGLTMDDGAGTITIDASGGSILTLGSAGLVSNKTAGTTTFGSNLTLDLDADQTWSTAGSGNNGRIYLTSDLTGTGNVTMTGNSTLIVAGTTDTSGWSGSFTKDGGSVNFQGLLGNNPLGSQTITLRNSTTVGFYFTHAGYGTLANDIILEDVGTGRYTFPANINAEIVFGGNISSTSDLGESIDLYNGGSEPHPLRFTGDNSGLTSAKTFARHRPMTGRLTFVAQKSFWKTIMPSERITACMSNWGRIIQTLLMNVAVTYWQLIRTM